MINLPGFGFTEGEFAKHLLGKKFEVVRAQDVKVGDTLIDFNCINSGHQIPTKITKVIQQTRDFYLFHWKGPGGQEGRQYALTCLFGKIIE